jgi:hypothetical protein
MTFEAYMKQVEEGYQTGIYPDAPTVPAGRVFHNNAGSITNLAIGDFRTCTFIHSHGNTVRSNHYHKTDSHFIYVLSGTVYYYATPVKFPGEPPSPVLMRRYDHGETFFTPPKMIHATYFPRSTELVVVSRFSRDHESHEADLVRVKLIEFNSDSGQIQVCSGYTLESPAK